MKNKLFRLVLVGICLIGFIFSTGCVKKTSENPTTPKVFLPSVSR